jgi:hypothetical protein
MTDIPQRDPLCRMIADMEPEICAARHAAEALTGYIESGHSDRDALRYLAYQVLEHTRNVRAEWSRLHAVAHGREPDTEGA